MQDLVEIKRILCRKGILCIRKLKLIYPVYLSFYLRKVTEIPFTKYIQFGQSLQFIYNVKYNFFFAQNSVKNYNLHIIFIQLC